MTTPPDSNRYYAARNRSLCNLLMVTPLLFASWGAYAQDPIVIRDKSNVVLEDLHITSSTGNCIELWNVNNVVIRNSTIGPCKGEAIFVYKGAGVKVENNRFCSSRSGVYALESSAVIIDSNYMRNIMGPYPRGQFAQFDKVNGAGSKIRNNIVESVYGQSDPQDAINIYKSDGTESSPIDVSGNYIIGGGPSTIGGGIIIDRGSDYVSFVANRLYNPGQYGVAIAGGHHVTVSDNKILGEQKPWSNVGLYVHNFYPSEVTCHSNTVSNNQISWVNKNGVKNPLWNPGDCGTVAGLSTNNWDAPLTPGDVLPSNFTKSAPYECPATAPSAPTELEAH